MGFLLVAALGTAMAVGSAASQAGLPREVLLLTRIKRRMAQNLEHIPDYTCLETIERSRRRAALQPFQVVDTVRLEVVVVGGKELYSWPGAEKFEEEEVGAIVTGGLISSGDFAMHAHDVFATTNPMFTYGGVEELDGRRALRYDFRIPLMASGWTITYGQQTGKVGSTGSFWADEQTLDVLRLEVNGDSIPPDLAIAEVFTRINYGKVRIGASEVVLPQGAEVGMTGLLGGASRNRIEFTHCREYVGESVISYEPPAEVVAAATPRRFTEVRLPVGLEVPVELDTAIDSQTARVGDLVVARVRTDVRQKNTLVVPRGALLKGRIRRLEKHDDRGVYFVVGLEFLAMEFDGKRAGFFGELRELGPLEGLSRQLFSSGLRRETRWQETITARQLPGVGTFFMRGSRFQLPRGLRMTWVTQEIRR